MNATLSRRMLELIQQLGITQKELAARATVSTAAISHYVKGERMPNSETLANIATALRTTSDYLMGKNSEEQFDYSQTYRILARNADNLTIDEKTRLIKVLFGEE